MSGLYRTPAASWMDIEGLSPVHQENFDWSTLNEPDKRAENISGIWYKKGSGWFYEEDEMLNRASRSTRI